MPRGGGLALDMSQAERGGRAYLAGGTEGTMPPGDPPQSNLSFPDISALPRGFIWGVSTSAFQIEGATDEDGRGASIWDTYDRLKQTASGDTGDVACDHYHRYPEDVALMRRLGVQAYRFSVAWPRILPAGRGAVNDKGLAFYDRLIDAILEAGIEPWLCLYHWDLPQALADAGGWTVRDSVQWFADYAAIVAPRYGDRVKRFATFNESSIFTIFTFALGSRAPKTLAPLHRAIHHVNLAHGAAVDVIRARVADASIGVIHNVQPCLPSSPDDAEAARRCAAYWNLAFPDPQYGGAYPELLRRSIEPYMQPGDLARIRRPLDWFGLNHYGPTYMRRDDTVPVGFNFGPQPAGTATTPIGWAASADAFRDTLLSVAAAYRVPVYVTENGLGARETPGEVADHARIDYLRRYIGAMNAAAARGADIRGYFVWSLLDNFEWDSGYAVRFGLVSVDYATQNRIPKLSYGWYRGLIEAARSR